MQEIVTTTRTRACQHSNFIEFALMFTYSYICKNDPNIQVMMSSVCRKDKINIFDMHVIYHYDSSSQVSRLSNLTICRMG